MSPRKPGIWATPSALAMGLGYVITGSILMLWAVLLVWAVMGS